MTEPSSEHRKATTHKGRKILQSRLPKAEEGIKKTLFLRSTKTSEAISDLMQELVHLSSFFYFSFDLFCFSKKINW